MTAEPAGKRDQSASADGQPAGTPPPFKEPPTGSSGFFAAVAQPRHKPEARPTGKRLAVLSLTALGVVYGDIGTSPLYALRQAFDSSNGFAPTMVAVYGVLSMILWALILIVAV